MADDFVKPSLLPPPLATDLSMRALEAVQSRVSDIPIAQGMVYDFENVDASALAHLGEQFHVMGAEGWRLATTDQQKRALLARAVALHRHKGTPWAIREALKAVGFNDLEINERLPAPRRDATLTRSGQAQHNGFGWAQFHIVADAGDDQPITSESTALIVETVNAWKPARSHLVDVQHRASTTEQVAVSELEQHTASLTHADYHRIAPRRDGSLTRNQGHFNRRDRSLAHDGGANRQGYGNGGIERSAAQELSSFAAVFAFADRQFHPRVRDGGLLRDGGIDHGASAPVAVEPPMQITLTRHILRNGRHTRDTKHRHNGSARRNGSANRAARLTHAGNIVTYLEV